MTEPTNADRAEWAQEALDVFGARTFSGTTFSEIVEQKEYPFGDTDAPDMLRDLMTNLYHLALAHGMDVKKLRDGCFMTFEEEHIEQITFDYAKDCFEANPSDFTASMLKLAADEYRGDDMISLETYQSALLAIDTFRAGRPKS